MLTCAVVGREEIDKSFRAQGSSRNSDDGRRSGLNGMIPHHSTELNMCVNSTVFIFLDTICKLHKHTVLI